MERAAITARNDDVGRRICVEAYGAPFPWSDFDAFTREEFVYDGDNVYRDEWRITSIAAGAPIPRQQWFTQAGVDTLLALTTANPPQMEDGATRATAGPKAFRLA